VTARAGLLLTLGAAYLIRLGVRRYRRWKVQGELRTVDTLIFLKGQQQRFIGFDPELREASDRRRAMADQVRKEARHLDSGGETDVRRKLRSVS
jgi:hypothetical protein